MKSMKSLETDSPAPYIAMGIIEQGDSGKQVPKTSRSSWVVLVQCITIAVLMIFIWKYNTALSSPHIELTVEHLYITSEHTEVEEEEEAMYVSEYEETQMYAPEERLSDVMYRLCSNVVPLEWPADWKSDPQLWSGRMRDDLDFCSVIFSDTLTL